MPAEGSPPTPVRYLHYYAGTVEMLCWLAVPVVVVVVVVDFVHVVADVVSVVVDDVVVDVVVKVVVASC